MANVSANNFLNLLFGGAQQGINEFRRQQGQQTDLLLTLQNMMQQRKQQEFQQGIATERLDIAKQQLNDARAEAVRNRFIQDWQMRQNALQQGLDRRRQAALDKSLIEQRAATTAATKALTGKRSKELSNLFTPGQVIQLEREYNKRKSDAKRMRVLQENAPDKYKGMFEVEEVPATFEEFLEQMSTLASQGGPRVGLSPAAGVSQMTNEQLLEALLGSE